MYSYNCPYGLAVTRLASICNGTTERDEFWPMFCSPGRHELFSIIFIFPPLNGEFPVYYAHMIWLSVRLGQGIIFRGAYVTFVNSFAFLDRDPPTSQLCEDLTGNLGTTPNMVKSENFFVHCPISRGYPPRSDGISHWGRLLSKKPIVTRLNLSDKLVKSWPSVHSSRSDKACPRTKKKRVILILTQTIILLPLQIRSASPSCPHLPLSLPTTICRLL
ncbi:hypothetical protein L228DRAFT_32118 [Xylona heveae TC161]|uniref:Uncharacterized protein n=1 Tax=Xylona heveae (strain CBS 132557 / TC161) TaxID=1328760 RepID=A0A165A4V7_XYLHT|nr:hypothetical protein L228DRAFT_32118 [Xylona heveae TC161]KZF19952.1 hypothetical protein L228DRAFT_32118 [Xylona heveae TC161]